MLVYNIFEPLTVIPATVVKRVTVKFFLISLLGKLFLLVWHRQVLFDLEIVWDASFWRSPRLLVVCQEVGASGSSAP